MNKIKEWIDDADLIIIGAGAGMSASAGIKYGEDGFKENFPELFNNYGMTDMYTSSFYNFKTEEERWSYWSKHIDYLCTGVEALPLYQKLYNIFKDKNYFVITTNVDRQFVKAGFDEDKVFEIQGTLTKIQCCRECHDKLYDDTNMVKEMIKYKNDIKIPSELVPYCPNCGEKMEVNLRKDHFFVEDTVWHTKNDRYYDLLNEYKNKKILFIELGAGFNTPSIIRYPFEEMTYKLPKAKMIRVNQKYGDIPEELGSKGIGFNEDIKDFIDSL